MSRNFLRSACRVTLAAALMFILGLQIAGLGRTAQSVNQAYAQVPGPFVSDPVTPFAFNVDLSEFDPVPPAGPEDPKVPSEGQEEDGIGAPEGVSLPIIGDQDRPLQQITTRPTIDSSWIAISNFFNPQPQMASAQGIPFGTPTVNFEGIPAAFVPELGGVPFPPDTNGDVGPNHYIQTVNSEFAIYDKSGNTLAGPLFLNTLFSGLPAGDPCATFNDGDPIAVYDHLADRWLISQFVAFSNQCIAVSMTPDPVAGGWFLYDFATGGVVNDYPHFGVWPDAYYMGTNAGYPSGHAWAFDRANMLAGAAATFQRFPAVGNEFNFFLPSDLDGPAPPAGAPNIFLSIADGAEFGGVDRLVMRAFHVDFGNPALSTFTALPDIPTLPFDRNCGTGYDLIGTCIPQAGSTEILESMTAWSLYSLQYRNFGTHSSLVVNHSVDANGANLVGIKWYELRQIGAGPWLIFQEGVHSPDVTTHRWMGSIAMDKEGNLALGYSTSSNSTSPSILYTGRLAADAPGTMSQGENNIMTGLASQFGGFSRWGDYSAMRVDPVDDCTFWYVTEYFGGPAGTSNQWSTRIASFKFPDCGNAVVGGELMSTNVAALLLAGALANGFWILPTMAGVGAAGILTALRMRKRKTSN